MHSDITVIGSIIRKARESKGMTISQLAKNTESSISTIANIERNLRLPKYDLLYRLVHTLDLSVDSIFWPNRIFFTPEYERLVRTLRACSEQEQAIFMKIAWAYVYAVKSEKGITKKADD